MNYSNHIEVTFKRINSGRTFVVRFECGEDNMRLVLAEAWKFNASIVSVVEV